MAEDSHEWPAYDSFVDDNELSDVRGTLSFFVHIPQQTAFGRKISLLQTDSVGIPHAYPSGRGFLANNQSAQVRSKASGRTAATLWVGVPEADVSASSDLYFSAASAGNLKGNPRVTTEWQALQVRVVSGNQILMEDADTALY